jgi:N,N-dimethylformamidase beta subunit-like protein/Big-like domain-containing protein
MNSARRLAYLLCFAATLLVTIAPRAALAQLNLGLGGSLIVKVTAPLNGASLTGTITARATYTSVGAITVQSARFKLDGADLGAAHQHLTSLGLGTVSFEEAWDTSTATNGTHTLTAVARDALGVQWTSAPVTVTVFNSPVATENQQPGSANWAIDGLAADDVGKQIKGYASATSVNKGDSIVFYVSVATAQTYTIDIYRMGYYQGLGGRLMQSTGPLTGLPQPPCPSDVNTGLAECNWAAGYTLAVPTSWTSGVFVAKLTSSAGYQNWIIFVVRDDARPAALVYQQPVNTYQGYNNYPNDNATGKSLYDFNSYGLPTVSGTARAVKVSWNRPYADRGAGQFFNWESYFIRWIERSGYDVKYVTNIDVHEHSDQLLGARGVLSIAMDENYSQAMYDGLEAARGAGVNLAFFGAGAVFWQVRFEASPATGAADRVLVCYKDQTKDPVQGPNTTIRWRDVGRPPQPLEGVQFHGQIDFSTPNVPFVVQNSSNWIYAGTGLLDGDQIPGIVGYEMDGIWDIFPTPDALSGTYLLLSASPYTDVSGEQKTAISSVYQAPSGAWVFTAGTTSWPWGLDLAGIADARVQRITSNVLDRFVGNTN